MEYDRSTILQVLYCHDMLSSWVMFSPFTCDPTCKLDVFLKYGGMNRKDSVIPTYKRKIRMDISQFLSFRKLSCGLTNLVSFVIRRCVGGQAGLHSMIQEWS